MLKKRAWVSSHMGATFAHLADCHIGSWKDPKMRDLSSDAFDAAVRHCIARGVDFVLIAGDLFHTSLPGIDAIKRTVEALKLLKDANIPVYLIPGSHDYSPSGRTMLDVLEKAALCQNVARGSVRDGRLHLDFTVDPKTGVKLAGILGRRNSLERGYFESLAREPLEQEPGPKVFVLHTAIEELKPKELQGVEAPPLSLLPRGFSYYAAGHVHYVLHQDIDGLGQLAYPGPLFPDSFRELEELRQGGFYVVRLGDRTEVERIPVLVRNVIPLRFDCDTLTPEEAEFRILEQVRCQEFVGAIVTLRLHGTLRSGRASDIDYKRIFSEIYSQGAYFMMRNTAALYSPDAVEVHTAQVPVHEIEQRVIREQSGHVSLALNPEEQQQLAASLLQALSAEIQEGERKQDYERRLIDAARTVLGLSHP